MPTRNHPILFEVTVWNLLNDFFVIFYSVIEQGVENVENILHLAANCRSHYSSVKSIWAPIDTVESNKTEEDNTPVRWVSQGTLRTSLPGAMYWESHSMNCLTGQLIVHTYSTVGWPGEGPLADKSSAALNKYCMI